MAVNVLRFMYAIISTSLTQPFWIWLCTHSEPLWWWDIW